MRVCSEPYELTPESITNAQVHLTNYSVNKDSAKFRGAASSEYDPDEDAGDASVRIGGGGRTGRMMA